MSSLARRRCRSMSRSPVGDVAVLPVEKLFMSEIGFTAASVGATAAAYAVVVPLLEGSGPLADRWRRSGVLALALLALAVSSLIGWLSHSVTTTWSGPGARRLLRALSRHSSTAIVDDTVLEETGSSDLDEDWIGRVRIVWSAGLVGSALLGGVLADLTSPASRTWPACPSSDRGPRFRAVQGAAPAPQRGAGNHP